MVLAVKPVAAAFTFKQAISVMPLVDVRKNVQWVVATVFAPSFGAETNLRFLMTPLYMSSKDLNILCRFFTKWATKPMLFVHMHCHVLFKLIFIFKSRGTAVALKGTVGIM